MHVTDIDPDRPGLEIYTSHEGATFAPYGMALRDAKTGEVIFGKYSGADTGRSMVGDVLPALRGLEVWASLPGGAGSLGLYSATGAFTPGAIPGTNMSIKWLPDGTTQIVNGSAAQDVTIDDWTRGRQLTATGTRSNNGTKGNPSLVADVLGDSREELLVRTEDSSAIRLFTNTGAEPHEDVHAHARPAVPRRGRPSADDLQPAVGRGLLPGLGHGLHAGAGAVVLRAGQHRRPA